MSTMTLVFDTDKSSMDEIRADLDAALHKEFPGGLLRRTWEGDVLQLSGPGAKGSIRFENGRLVGEADLTSPPASLMKGMIEQKISNAMQAAIG